MPFSKILRYAIIGCASNLGSKFVSLRATRISRRANAGDAMVVFSRATVILGNNLALWSKSLTHSYSSKKLVSADFPLSISSWRPCSGEFWYLSYPKFQAIFGSLKSYTSKDQHVIFQASLVQDYHGITMSPVQTTMIYASWIFCKPNLPNGAVWEEKTAPPVVMQLQLSKTKRWNLKMPLWKRRQIYTPQTTCSF